ncbi:MAG: AAA family ATPase, partial [Bacteroidota bacterium]
GRRAGTYSKGMRQKVGVALALAKGAQALLLDEPTSGLDPSASVEFSDLVRRLASDGAAVLMATHDLSEADLAGFLDRAGLQGEAHGRRAGTYSKGMRQKVGVALALAKGAKALLLDEPTSGLDPSASVEFSGLVRRLAEDGAAVLMATHDLFRVKDTASRVGVLVDGRLREEVAPEALHATDLEALYLGHVRGAEAPVSA